MKRVEETRGEAVRTRVSLFVKTVASHSQCAHSLACAKEKASHAANGGDVESNGWPGRWRQGMC